MYYTSYFGKMKNIKGYQYGPFAVITANKPKFLDSSVLDWSFLGPEYLNVVAYKNKEITEEEYSKRYLSYLEESWPRFENFLQFNYCKNIVLLCYEKPDKFCHRHLLAQFLRDHGFECEEIK